MVVAVFGVVLVGVVVGVVVVLGVVVVVGVDVFEVVLFFSARRKEQKQPWS